MFPADTDTESQYLPVANIPLYYISPRLDQNPLA